MPVSEDQNTSFQKNRTMLRPNDPNEPIDEDKSQELHSKILSLISFLRDEADQHRHNIKQLKAMEGSLKEAFYYRDEVNNFLQSKKIPRTWSSDLNKYTMFQ